MTSLLRPITAVKCPKTEKLVSIKTCETCEDLIEIRRPWRHFIVHCSVGNKAEAISP